jgi:hypothetical protein
MTGPAHWKELERLYEAGAALDPHARETWLSQQVLEPALREELQAMFAAMGEHTGLSGRIESLFAAAQPVAGTRIGPYRLMRELGSGGMGMVYLAERADRQFRQQVAIKLIRGLAGSYAAGQLRHERQILAELVHPNIARLLDGGETAAGDPYLVMEYVAGQPITAACTARNVPLAQRVALVRDVALAVHYAHQRLVIHRDIKPANVLLRDDGVPLLLDFGIARLMDKEASAVATQPWFTPAYASPEQRRGLALSTATDVHALGVLLSELLTDKPPMFDSQGRLVPPSQVADAARRPALRNELDRIVLRAAAEEPARRYASAEAFAEDLERYLAGEAVQAVPDSLHYRLRKAVQRHPYGSLIVATAVVLLLFSSWRLARERDAALQAQAQAQQARAQMQMEAQASQAVSDYLVALFEDANPERGNHASMAPLELIERGRQRLADAPRMAPAQRAALLTAIGNVYLNLGHPDQAGAVLDEALQARDALAPSRRAHLLYLAAKAAGDRLRYQEAERYYLEARDLLRTLDEPRQLAWVLEGLGVTYSRADRNAEAEINLREAMALQTRLEGTDGIDTLFAQVSLAEALFNSDRTDEARALMDEGIAKLRKALPPDDFRLLTKLSRYASLLVGMGDFDAAEPIFLEVLERDATLKQDNDRLGGLVNDLGVLYYGRGEPLKAIQYLRQAYEIAQRTGQKDDPAHLPELNNLGVLYVDTGDYAQAEPLLRRAAALGEHSADPMLRSAAELSLGYLLMLTDRADEALRWLEKPIAERADLDWTAKRHRQRALLAEWQRRYGDPAQAQRLADEALDELRKDPSKRNAGLLAAVERTQGLLLGAEGQYAEAQQRLASADAHLVEQRGERYTGVGSLSLDRAELFVAAGDLASARRELDRAHAILDARLVITARDRTRMAALGRALGR